MEQAFSSRGSKAIYVEPGSSLNIGNLNAVTFPGGKINILNDTDNLLYTLACQNVAGQPVLYLWRGGNARVIAGIYYLQNDTDNLWYALRTQIVASVAVPYLATPGIVLP